MRFTLVFDGELKSRNHADPSDRMTLRREFHRQLEEVWQRKIFLEKHLEPWREWAAQGTGAKAKWEALTEEQRKLHCDNSLLIPFFRGGFCFVPIVTKRHYLVCELDILFLRAEKPGSLFNTNSAGDLDNRLKVLIDALTVPRHDNQMPPAEMPQTGEDPLLCLLEDDELITAIRIESERLYEPSDHGPQKNNVRLTIRVTVKAQQFSWITSQALAD